MGHPEIANPEYVDDDSMYQMVDSAAVGFDLWQVKAGTIFDNIIVTDDVQEAEAYLEETFGANKAAEKKMFDEIKEEEKKKEEDDDDEEEEEDSTHDEL